MLLRFFRLRYRSRLARSIRGVQEFSQNHKRKDFEISLKRIILKARCFSFESRDRIYDIHFSLVHRGKEKVWGSRQSLYPWGQGLVGFVRAKRIGRSTIRPGWLERREPWLVNWNCRQTPRPWKHRWDCSSRQASTGFLFSFEIASIFFSLPRSFSFGIATGRLNLAASRDATLFDSRKRRHVIVTPSIRLDHSLIFFVKKKKKRSRLSPFAPSFVSPPRINSSAEINPDPRTVVASKIPRVYFSSRFDLSYFVHELWNRRKNSWKLIIRTKREKG